MSLNISSPKSPPSLCLYLQHPAKNLNLAFPLPSAGVAKRFISIIAGGSIKHGVDCLGGMDRSLTGSGFYIYCPTYSIPDIVRTKPTDAEKRYYVPKSWYELPNYDPKSREVVSDDPREKRRLRRMLRSSRAKSATTQLEQKPTHQFNVANICRSMGVNPKAGRRLLRSLPAESIATESDIRKALEGLK